jgi:alpha-tubulin suppressor-like RCC1 family protein
MQLGDETSKNSPTPLLVAGLGKDILKIDAGSGHNCILTKDGKVKCWGENWFGQLGNGTSDNSASPVDVSGLGQKAVQLSTGAGHTCALLSNGVVQCWGLNGRGQLGDGTNQDRTAPVDVTGL